MVVQEAREHEGENQSAAGGADPVTDALSAAEAKKVIDGLRVSPMVSAALRTYLNELCRRV